MIARLTVRDSENTRYMTYWRFEWTPVFWSKFNRHNGHQYFFYKVQNCTLDGRVVFNDQSVVCLWPKQDYIVFIVLLKFPVMIWSLYHKLLCGNLFLFPIVFFSISKKAYSFNSGIPDSFSSLSSQSHDTADKELILTARLIYKTIACENIHFSSLFTAGDVSRNVPSGEERGETDVFAG